MFFISIAFAWIVLYYHILYFPLSAYLRLSLCLSLE
jgi:hypothetical protein